MPILRTENAVERLARKLEHDFDPAELREVYNELSEKDPRAPDAVGGDLAQMTAQLVDRLTGGKEPEDVLTMWNLVFPRDRRVWFNEETGLYHYNEEEARSVD